MDAAKDDDAPDQTGSSDRWALAAQLPPEPSQPTPTFVTVRELDPAEFAEVETANAMLRRFTTGSPYQRLHQAVRLLGQHAERARTSAARVPQPPLQRETARIDRAVSATLTASEALLGSLVNDIVTDYGEQSRQAVTMREAVDQARDRSLVVVLSRPLLALSATQPSLVEMRNLSGHGPFAGEDGGESSEPVWEPVLRESVATTLVTAVGPAAAPLTTAPVRIVRLLQELVVVCQRLFARHLLLQEDRIAAGSLRLRRLAAEVLDGAPVLMSTRGDPAHPQIDFRELALDEIRLLQRALRQARRLLAAPVIPPPGPPTASSAGTGSAAPPASGVDEEATDQSPTGEDSSTGGGEAEGASMTSTVDLLATVEHASRLTVAAERAWSAALDPAALDEAKRELLDDQWSNVMAVVRRQAELSSRALEAAGLDATVDQFPPDVSQFLALDLDPDPERRRRQLQLAQFYALDQLLAALQGLRHPSRAALDPRTGQLTQTWWDSGAFALVRTRAQHLVRVTLALLNAEQAAIAAATGQAATTQEQVSPPAQPPPWWAHLHLSADALGRGDIEATLLHAYLALTARFTDVPSLADAVAAPFGEEAEAEAAKTLVAKLEEVIARLAEGSDVDLGVTVPLAQALLPLIQRLLLPVPMTRTPTPSATEAADDLGPATPPDDPSDADPSPPQADT